jgi:hypothetical protein
MGKLEIKTKKKLVLKNTLKYEIKDGKIENMDKEVQKFITYLDISKIKTLGPLVTCTGNFKIDQETGIMTSDFSVMIQLQSEYSNHPDYIFSKEEKVGNCLYLKFNDKEEFVQYATKKLDLAIYENDLTRNGGIYQVLIKRSEGYVETDFFQPIEEVIDEV